MVAGRPRKSSPSPSDCIKLGEDLIKWLTEETKEFRFLFQQWYSLKHGILRKDWKNIIVTPEFSPYYEQAQSILSRKCLDGTVKEGFGHRYLRLYDRCLIDSENEHARFEAEIKAKEQKNISDEDMKRFDQFMDYLKAVKEKSS